MRTDFETNRESSAPSRLVSRSCNKFDCSSNTDCKAVDRRNVFDVDPAIASTACTRAKESLSIAGASRRAVKLIRSSSASIIVISTIQSLPWTPKDSSISQPLTFLTNSITFSACDAFSLPSLRRVTYSANAMIPSS